MGIQEPKWYLLSLQTEASRHLASHTLCTVLLQSVFHKCESSWVYACGLIKCKSVKKSNRYMYIHIIHWSYTTTNRDTRVSVSVSGRTDISEASGSTDNWQIPDVLPVYEIEKNLHQIPCTVTHKMSVFIQGPHSKSLKVKKFPCKLAQRSLWSRRAKE